MTTKTVSQGEHVSLMFPMIFEKNIEIGFAYDAFQWDNNAKRNADVTVAVINLRAVSARPKFLYVDGLKIAAKNINGYLADGDNVFIGARSKPLSLLPPMIYGSKATDGGNLMLEPMERDQMLASSPSAAPYIKRILGSAEFINGKERYCIWVNAENRGRAEAIPSLASRFQKTSDTRLASTKEPTRRLAEVPYRFGETRYKPTESIIVPSISSGLRDYIPIGYLDADTVISNKGFAIYDAEPWVFAVLTSQMHMAWVNAVSGRMRINYQYSNTIVYNNFPLPALTETIKEKLTLGALRILDVREYHCERTLAELYDPDNMPGDLRAAHAQVDALVDSIYSRRGYETDEQRLADLFDMYKTMAAVESSKGKKR